MVFGLSSSPKGSNCPSFLELSSKDRKLLKKYGDGKPHSQRPPTQAASRRNYYEKKVRLPSS